MAFKYPTEKHNNEVVYDTIWYGSSALSENMQLPTEDAQNLKPFY